MLCRTILYTLGSRQGPIACCSAYASSSSRAQGKQLDRKAVRAPSSVRISLDRVVHCFFYPIAREEGAMRNPMATGILFAVLWPCLAAPETTHAAPEQALVIRRADSDATLQELLAALEAQGGRARHIFPPDAAVVELPSDKPAKWGEDLTIYRGPVPRALVNPAVLPTRIASTIWNDRFAPPRRLAQDVIEGPRETLENRQSDARIFPLDRSQPPPGAGPANALTPGYYDTSEFFMGSVAVGVFLMESNGDAYNWSDSEVTQTLNGIYAAMDWWINRGGAAAHLSFTYDLHIRQPTAYEPIQGPSSNENLWIGEAMTGLGYSSYSGIRQYLNDLRAAHGTNWAYAIFVVDSSSSVNQGRFTDGAYAWGNLGGPWLVMSRYSSWAYNSANYYEAVPAHETGHIFYATDEYDGLGQVSGYLNAHDNDGAICLMNQNYLGNLCAASTLQIGWRDSDRDGINDILDTDPETTLTPFSPDPTTQTVLGYMGTATVVALTNQNPYGSGNDITLQTLTKVEFRVDSGAWSQAIPDDGAFDGPVESFHFNTPILTPGSHTVEARAVSSVGNLDTTPASDTVTVMAGAYTLNVSTAGSGTGTVTSSPAGINCGADCSEPYASGASVTLTATPASGSMFSGWSGDCSGTGACVVSMSAARSVTATFSSILYTLTASKAGSGTGMVTSSPAGINCGADCSEPYVSGTSVTLTATPASGSTFSGWSGDCSGTGACVVSMSAARSVTATFSSILYSLTASKAGSGTGTVTSSPAGINCGTDCSEPYASGTSVTLTATPASGSMFSAWSGDCSGTGACVVSMSAARSVTATFSSILYTLTASKAGSGTGTVTSSPAGINCGTDCSEPYASGTSVTLAATPASGSMFSGWSGDCSGTGACVLSMTSVHTATATFSTSISTFLQFVRAYFDGQDGISPMNRVESIVASSDGNQLYVAAYYSNAVLVLSRNPSTGALALLQVLQDGVGGVDGLAGIRSLALSPDGRHLYVAGLLDSAIAVLTRDPATGLLTPGQVVRNGVGGVDGLFWIATLTVSPDGRHLYAASIVDRAVTAFTRDEISGTLAQIGIIRNGDPGVLGLDRPELLTMSPDGKNLYLASSDASALVVFRRDTSAGTLALIQVLQDGVGEVDGLGGAFSVAVSPDGNHVYAAGKNENALSIFQRNSASGSLSYLTTLRDGVGGVEGLGGVSGLAFSRDGMYLYLAADADTSLTLFERNVNSGSLTFRETHRRGVNGVQGLWGAQPVAVSPDERNIYVGSLFDNAVAHFSRPAPPAAYTLAVSKNGSGSGKVTSYPAGISCGSDCSEFLTAGAVVTLTAQPAPGSTFAGWSGGCSGTGNCTIVLASSQTVTATFFISDVALQNDVALLDTITATTRQGSWKYYWIDVSGGSSNLIVDLYNLSADFDLYVRFGDKPTSGSYDCRPYAGGLAAEQCSFPAPAAGRWWIGVNNWEVGSMTYTVRAKWSAPVFSGDLSFYTVPPCRVFDSRNNSALASNETRQIQITGVCSIPSSARAVSLNLTVTQPSSGGFLALWPSGVAVNTSSINFLAGETRANNAILALAATGQGTLSAQPSLQSNGTAHLVLDVNGYFQ
jgi:6-phosphogluconolactonase (cycloisomerase 2 family)